MHSTRLLLVLFFLGQTASVLAAGEPQLGVRVPPGFEVTEYAESQLANDIFSMTLDPRGRVVVSGRGYLRILVDDNQDGRADRALDFANGPKDGAMGLLWEGTALFVTGDGGLRRYRDADGDDRADGPAELIRALKTGGEHDAHAIKRGPDGWLYVLCGNSTGINKTFAQLPTSPIRDPIAGCVLRFTPDLQLSEIVADGFRNAYDMDFNADGELFTYDSDNERCVSLPWYEGTRFYHVIPGGHHGWQSHQRAQWWRFPPYFCDVVAPLADLGRGSPTGVACYRQVQFPEHYRGGFFLLDWTFGKVYFMKLERSGSTYTCRQEVFLEAVGDNGFAPTAVAVHPDTGDLFIAIGGRGTRGAIYRIRYPRGVRPITVAERATWQVRPRSLEWQPGLQRDWLQQASRADASERLRALQTIRRHRLHFDSEQLQEVIRANWDHPDRYLRQAATELLASLDDQAQRALLSRAQTTFQVLTAGLARCRVHSAETLAPARRLLAQDTGLEGRLTTVRLLQCALGDLMSPQVKGTVWEGYSPRWTERWPRERERSASDRNPISFDAREFSETIAALRQAFPSGHAQLDRELARTLAMVEDADPATLDKIAGRLTTTSPPLEDIHYLVVLARLRAPRSAALTTRVADALLALDRKLAQQQANRDRNWPLRMAELHAELARKDVQLNAALLNHAEFGRPDHALLTQAPGFDRRRAAELFLARAAKDEEYPWSPALVELLGHLPQAQALPALRHLWSKGGLEEVVVPLLARQPQADDRDKFLAGLNSPQLATIRLCLEALDKLPRRQDPMETLALVRAFGRLPDGSEANPVRERLAHYLRRLSGQAQLGADKQAWALWFTSAHPDLAARLSGADGVDSAGWARRLAQLDWSIGEMERGRSVYAKVGCITCHSGAQALGPDLQGVTGRFSRADLFTAILQPSRDISPRYRTTLVATAAAKVYQGMVIYDAVDSLILQTGPATTVRLPGQQIVARRFTDHSLMPAGLLDKLSDREIADLYAYLKSLSSPSSKKR